MDKKIGVSILFGVLILIGVVVMTKFAYGDISTSSTIVAYGDGYNLDSITKAEKSEMINLTIVLDTIPEHVSNITIEWNSGNYTFTGFTSGGDDNESWSGEWGWDNQTASQSLQNVTFYENGSVTTNVTCANLAATSITCQFGTSGASTIFNGSSGCATLNCTNTIMVRFNVTAASAIEDTNIWNITLFSSNGSSWISDTSLETSVDGLAPSVSTIERVTESATTTYNDATGVEYKCSGSDPSGIKKYTWTLIKPNGDEVETIHTNSESSDTITFKQSDLNRLGTHNVKCKIKDVLDYESGEKTISNSEIFVVHAQITGTGSGGVSDGGPAAVNFDTDFTTTNEGSIKAQQGRVKSFSFDGVTKHTIIFNTVTTSSVTLTIASTPVTITLNIGETKDVDVNADGTNDMSVKLNNILNSVADVTIKKIEEGAAKILGEEEAARGVEPEVTPEVTTPVETGLTWLWWLIGIIIVVALGYYFFFRKK